MGTMKHLTDAVEDAVKASNWYAALTVALTLPDIAGWVDDPRIKSQARYAAWVEAHLSPTYTSHVGHARELHKFLSGDDCYALRCAFLHEGRDDTSEQRAADALTRFLFTAPRPGLTLHRNQSGTKLQLQVDLFCREMCTAVRTWLTTIGPTDVDRASRLAQLATIQSTSGALRF